MRFISMDRVKPGMVMAKAIRDDNNRILLNEGKILSSELIQRLAGQGYAGIYIEDELSKDIVIQEAISVELRSRASMAVRNMDVDGIAQAAKNIVEQILNAQSISLDMVDLRTFDDYTYAHSVNVAVLSCVMGLGLKYSQDELIDLCQAAMFHDLGKLQIDKSILNKPGKLNVDELKVIQGHPQKSYDILAERWNIPSRVKLGVLSHHENEDGSGYPMGLEGDKIHDFAKIIHVADVYDALSSKRPYKKAYSYAESLEYLMGGCYVMFDAHMVNAFLRCVPVYPKGTTILLSDGREGIVLENTANYSLRPQIRLMNGEVVDLMNDASARNITIVGGGQTESISSSQIEEYERQRKLLLS